MKQDTLQNFLSNSWQMGKPIPAKWSEADWDDVTDTRFQDVALELALTSLAWKRKRISAPSSDRDSFLSLQGQ